MTNDQSDRKSFVNIPINYDTPWGAVRADSTAENSFIANMGILFAHYRAVPCPLGALEVGDIRHSHDHGPNSKIDCENGFIYTYAGDVWGIFQSNNKKYDFIPPGYYGNSVAIVTFNRYYRDSDKTAAMAEFDKLVPLESPKEFFGVSFQKIQHNPTGIDRTQFKVCSVEDLIDSDGRLYANGKDFIVNQHGNIEWINGGERPGIDNRTDKGKIYAVRYRYKPYFYVKAMLHELRVKPSMDTLTGDITTKSGPTQCAVQVDFIFLANATDKSDAPDAMLEPQDTSNTGPR